MKDRCYVFFNGSDDEDEDFYIDLLHDEENIYCADGGANLCFQLGMIPKEIWGDMDSIDKDIYNHYNNHGILFKYFDTDKDFTDGELLIKYLSDKYKKIYVLFGDKGSTEHKLTNINLVFKYSNVYFLNSEEKIFNVPNKKIFKGLEGHKISFVPFSDEVINLSLKGFKYNLDNKLVKRGDTLCVSNIITDKEATLSFDSGKLLGILKNNH